jgi:hypothetical protein
MKATGWKGGTYGIRVGKENAKRYFDRSWNTIQVDIDGRVHQFPLNETFWTTCPEFRGAEIGVWLCATGLAPWPRGHPPQVLLSPLGSNRFRLSR